MIATLVFIGFGFGGLSVYYFAGAAACFWEVALCLVAMPWAIWYDWNRGRLARQEHPDNNFHNLPLLNALAFNKNGAPIHPDSREGKRWLKDPDNRRRYEQRLASRGA